MGTPEDDAACEVAHVQPASHFLEVVFARHVALAVQLPVLLQPGQHLRGVVRPLLKRHVALGSWLRGLGRYSALTTIGAVQGTQLTNETIEWIKGTVDWACQ